MQPQRGAHNDREGEDAATPPQQQRGKQPQQVIYGRSSAASVAQRSARHLWANKNRNVVI